MAVVLLLQERNRRCDDIAGFLAVSRRTVMRDIQSLYAMGIPIHSQEGAGGGYSLASDSSLKPLELSWKEALLLIMAVDGLAKLSDSPFSADRMSLIAKVRHLIPTKHFDKLAGLRDSIVLAVPDRTSRAPMLDSLVEWVGTGKWIRVTYESESGLTERLVRPDRLYAESGFWYLECQDGLGARMMRVDRMIGMESATEPENVQEALPYGHFSNPLVRVHLSRRGSRIVQNEPHLGKLVNSISEMEIEFRCPPSELDWYAKYFSGLGTDAKVIEPVQLIEKIRNRAQDILILYSDACGATEQRPV